MSDAPRVIDETWECVVLDPQTCRTALQFPVGRDSGNYLKDNQQEAERHRLAAQAPAMARYLVRLASTREVMGAHRDPGLDAILRDAGPCHER